MLRGESGTRIRLIDRLDVEVCGVPCALPPGQATDLFALLVLTRHEGITRDRLIDMLWGERAPRDPGGVLSGLLSRLRGTLGADAIVRGSSPRLALPEPIWIDVEQDPTGEGTLLPQIRAEWIEPYRRDHEERRHDALEAAAEVALEAGDADAGASLARRLVADAPFRESGHRLLMKALDERGNRAEALRVYEDLRALLRDELGTAPSAEVAAAHARLLEDRPRRSPGGRPPLPASLARAAETPLLEREADLQRLRSALERVRGGRVHVVVIEGEPGIGKTALAAAFAMEVHAGGATVLAARAMESLDRPFGAIADALRPLGPELAGSASGDAPERERWWILETVAAAVAQQAAREPVVLVMDDLQWADEGTLSALSHTVRVAPESRAPVLLIATLRPGEVVAGGAVETTLGDLAREAPLEHLRLAGLTPAAVGKLLGEQPPEELAAMVADRTSGNPFFVEELVRHLREEDGRLEAIPDRVVNVVRARYRRLSESARRTLEAAAVLGRGVEPSLLAEVAEAEVADLYEDIDSAVGAALLRGDASPEDPVRFAHDLTREAIYGVISPARRGRLHLRAGEAIERRAPERVDELVRHFAAAAPQGGADRAVRYALVVGGLAMRSAAPRTAVTAYELGYASMDHAREVDDRSRAEFAFQLAEARRSAGFFAGSNEAYVEAERCAERAQDDLLALKARIRRYQGSLIDGWDAGAEAILEEAANVFEAAGDVEGLCYTLHSQGQIEMGALHMQRVVEVSERVATLARDRLPFIESRALSRATFAAWHGPSPAEDVLASCDAALERLEALGAVDGQAFVQLTRAASLAMLDRLDEAQVIRARAVESLTRVGLVAAPYLAPSHYVATDPYRSDPYLTERHLRKAIEVAYENGAAAMLAMFGPNLAEAVIALGRVEEGLRYAAEGEAHTGIYDFDGQLGWRRARARALAHLGRTDDAIALIEQALPIAATTDALVQRAALHEAAADVYALGGRSGEARDHLRLALEMHECKHHLPAIRDLRARLAT